MYSKASAVLGALAFLQQWSSSYAQSSSSTYSADQSTTTACPQQGGAHIIVARGSLESPPYGVLVKVKDDVLSQVPGSTADGAIGYPDTLADYMNSETAGAIVARGLITDYYNNCPGLPLVVMGYSQGAQVLGDALVGQMDNAFTDNSTIDQPLPANVLSTVAAVVFMGDPTFNVTEPFLVGTANMSGSFPRKNVANFNIADLGSRTHSYCDYNDLFCAGGNSLAVHVGYVPEYGTQAASFVVSQISAWYASHTSGSSATGVPVATGSMSKKPSVSATAAKTGSTSVCPSVSSRASRMTASASASGSRGLYSSATPSSSATATMSGPVQATGAASNMGMAGAAAGVAAFGFFAAML